MSKESHPGQAAGSSLQVLVDVLVSCGCCDKMLQAGQLKMAEMCSHTVLEGGTLKSRCWQDCNPSQALEEKTTRGSQLSLACGRRSRLCLHRRMAFLCVSVSVSLSLLGITCKVHPNPGSPPLEILNLLISAKTLKSHSQVSGGVTVYHSPRCR